MLAYAVRQRRHELGVRRALGASSRRIVGEVLGEGVAYALAGCLVGLAGASLVARLLPGQPYGVDPYDAATFVASAAAILIGVLVTGVVPAYRAVTVDARASFRSE